MYSISVVVAIYQDIEALNIILDSLYNQTFKGEFEVIVAEDGRNSEVDGFIKSLSYPNLKHTKHEDLGWRKNRSMNNAIRTSENDFLIFIDGDCVPSQYLMENYEKLISSKQVLCGRRVELGNVIASELRTNQYTIRSIEKKYFKNYLKLHQAGSRHIEEGIILNDFLWKLKYKNYQSTIIGCNFGILKADIETINGFDETYLNASVGEDTDIEWRMSSYGFKMTNIRNKAPVFHLFHAQKYSKEDNEISLKLLSKRKTENNLICKNGLKQHP